MKTLKSVLQNIAGILQTVYSFFMLLGGGWIFLIFIERWTPEEALLFLFSLSSLGIGISSAILADSLIGGRKNPDEAFREEIAPSREKVGNAQGDVEQPQKEVTPPREESEPFQEEAKRNKSITKKSIAIIVLNVVYVLSSLLLALLYRRQSGCVVWLSPELCSLFAIPSSIVILLTAVSLILPSDSPKSN